MIYRFLLNTEGSLNFIYSNSKKGFSGLTRNFYSALSSPPKVDKTRVVLAPSSLSDWGEDSD